MAPKPSPLGLGFKADGMQAYDYYRPSILEFSADITKAECLAGTNAIPWETSVPVPSGMTFRKAPNQLLLAVDERFAMRFQRAYGYVGGDFLSSRRQGDPHHGADTGSYPGCRQAVVAVRPHA